jgi:chaperonin cofactor prefoldin
MDPEIQKQMGAMRLMRQQQQNCVAKVQALKQTTKKIELTQKEISTLPEDINCYASVGRCFVFKPRSAIDDAMSTQLKSMAEQIEKNETQRVALEKKEKEIKDTVEELMKAAKK